MSTLRLIVLSGMVWMCAAATAQPAQVGGMRILVVDEDNAAVAEAMIELASTTIRGDDRQTLYGDCDGRLVLSQLEIGLYRVRAHHPSKGTSETFGVFISAESQWQVTLGLTPVSESDGVERSIDHVDFWCGDNELPVRRTPVDGLRGEVIVESSELRPSYQFVLRGDRHYVAGDIEYLLAFEGLDDDVTGIVSEDTRVRASRICGRRAEFKGVLPRGEPFGTVLRFQWLRSDAAEVACCQSVSVRLLVHDDSPVGSRNDDPFAPPLEQCASCSGAHECLELEPIGVHAVARATACPLGDQEGLQDVPFGSLASPSPSTLLSELLPAQPAIVLRRVSCEEFVCVLAFRVDSDREVTGEAMPVAYGLSFDDFAMGVRDAEPFRCVEGTASWEGTTWPSCTHGRISLVGETVMANAATPVCGMRFRWVGGEGEHAWRSLTASIRTPPDPMLPESEWVSIRGARYNPGEVRTWRFEPPPRLPDVGDEVVLHPVGGSVRK